MAQTMEEEIDGLDLTNGFTGGEEPQETEVKEEPKNDEPKAEQEVKPEEPPKGPGNGEGGESPKEEPKDGPKDPFGVKNHTPKGVQERINELSRSNREKNEQIASLKREVEALKKSMPRPPEKTRDDFANDEEWINHLAGKRAKEMFEQETAKWREERELREANESYAKSEEGARTLIPDYDDVMSREVNLPVDRETYMYVMKSPLGAMVNYTLRKVEAVRNQFLMTPDAGKLAFIKGVEERLRAIQSETGKQKADTPPQPQQAPQPQAVPQQEPKPALRTPQDVRHPVSRKLNASDMSEAAVDEWVNSPD